MLTSVERRREQVRPNMDGSPPHRKSKRCFLLALGCISAKGSGVTEFIEAIRMWHRQVKGERAGAGDVAHVMWRVMREG